LGALAYKPYICIKFDMARIMALDYGAKRTGIAITDEMQIIASGLATVPTSELLVYLEKYFTSENVELVLMEISFCSLHVPFP